MVWLSIEIVLYITAGIHGIQEAFWPHSSPTTYILNVRWWQHHQARLSRMSTNLQYIDI
jgi:hypothetical protein